MELYALWLAMVLGSRCLNGEAIVKGKIDPEKLYENRKSWHQYSFFTTKQMGRALEIPIENAQKVLEAHRVLDIKTLTYMDKEYPDSFKAIFDAPTVLFYKGDINLLKGEDIVGIIGARNPDRDGIKICGDIATELSQNGVIIASGLAQGLDGKAHEAALEANGTTIAFIGTALDRTYPAAHKSLQEKIIRKGCVITEYYIGAPTPPTTFLERNRLIAASSKAICIIQAKHRSGSLATARNAIEYEKQIFAVPGTITNSIYDGTNQLIQDGAIPLLKGKNVLEFLGLFDSEKRSKRAKVKPILSQEEQGIYDCLNRQTKSTHQIFAETRIPMVRLKALLTKLEMDRIIVAQSAGVYYRK